MKRWFGRFAVIGAVALVALALVPSAFAASNFIKIENATLDCGTGQYGFDVSYRVEAGGKLVTTESVSGPGGNHSQTHTDVAPVLETGTAHQGGGGFPTDTTYEVSFTVYNPDGSFATSAAARFSCPSGNVWVSNYDGVAGILPPDPAHRVMGTVLYTTPLYGQADPGTVVPNVQFTAGQTWFVVGAKTGTDGKQWYEVFPGGGANNVFVPAAAIQLQGALPPQ